MDARGTDGFLSLNGRKYIINKGWRRQADACIYVRIGFLKALDRERKTTAAPGSVVGTAVDQPDPPQVIPGGGPGGSGVRKESRESRDA